VRAAWAAGQRDFGENKVQEALQKIAETSDIAIRWHLIGHLQSNKAKRAAAPFACIHSVDSVDLLEKLDAAAAAQGAAPEVLVQVDLAGEATKFGADVSEARRLLDAALAARAVRLSGLMLIPPWNEDQEQTRPWFVRLRELRDRWIDEGVPPTALAHLSMGMSHDFEAAIEEGATMVRVGTAIFGKRTVRT
jgi:pyridoxal phosphate enzyme (YggS family)